MDALFNQLILNFDCVVCVLHYFNYVLDFALACGIY